MFLVMSRWLQLLHFLFQVSFYGPNSKPKPSAAVLTRLRFSPVAEFEPECVLLEL